MKRCDVQVCEFFERTVIGNDQQNQAGEKQFLRRYSSGAWEIYSKGAWFLAEKDRWSQLDFDRQAFMYEEQEVHQDDSRH